MKNIILIVSGDPNSINSELIFKAWKKINNFQKNPNKSNYFYILTPSGIKEKTKLTLNFMKRKMQEYEELKRNIK